MNESAFRNAFESPIQTKVKIEFIKSLIYEQCLSGFYTSSSYARGVSVIQPHTYIQMNEYLVSLFLCPSLPRSLASNAIESLARYELNCISLRTETNK